jgi:hypothetical protein
MHSFAMLLKSYSGDVEYAARLVRSFERFNADGVTLYVVVPDDDVVLFTPLASDHVVVLSEALLAPHLVDHEVHELSAGYINQEIVKLAFWELELAAHYFCVDSDAEFIRPFHRSDFMVDESTPYTVLVEDNELKVEPRYYAQYWVRREAEIRRIQELVGLDTDTVLTCHGHQVMSAAVLRSLRDDFLAPRGWDYADALAESPFEFSWYNMWLQRSRVIEIHPREPLVKVFHHEGQHLEYVLRGITVDDIARGYVALVVNSNYSRDIGMIPLGADKPEVLSHYLSYGEVGRLLSAKARDTLRRRLPR